MEGLILEVEVNLIPKGVIIGGHERWQLKIREVLPVSWRFINIDENINIDILNKCRAYIYQY